VVEPDQTDIIRLLDAGRDALLASLEGMSGESAARKPHEGWSVLECVEHCAITEERLLHAMIHLSKPAGRTDRSAFEHLIITRATRRSRKVDAPDYVRPAGRFADVPSALAAFHESRRRTLDYIRQAEGDLRDRTVMHPIGEVTVREGLLLLAMHPARHALQIRELRS
jgi:hypothetical protein